MSLGESIKIVTDTATEDYLVECKKSHNYLIGHNASVYTVSGKTFIAKSGEEESCGLIVYGFNSHAHVSHPTYKRVIWDKNNMKVKYTENDAKIMEFIHWQKRNTQALELYKSGFWSNYTSPLDEYLQRLSHCYISKKQLETYGYLTLPNYSDFKNKFYDEILECNREAEKIRHKHGKSRKSFYYAKWGRYDEILKNCASNYGLCKKNRVYLPERTIAKRNNAMWNHIRWAPFLTDGEKQSRHLSGETKKTFIVGYGLQINIRTWHELDKKSKHIWLKIDAYSKKDITRRFRGFTIFDSEPIWLPTYKKENYIKTCDGDLAHVDLDNMPSMIYKTMYDMHNNIKTSYCYND